MRHKSPDLTPYLPTLRTFHGEITQPFENTWRTLILTGKITNKQVLERIALTFAFARLNLTDECLFFGYKKFTVGHTCSIFVVAFENDTLCWLMGLYSPFFRPEFFLFLDFF